MRTVRRAVRMSEEAWRAIKVAAATEGITMGEWIEQVVKARHAEWLDRTMDRLMDENAGALERLGRE